MKRTNKKGFTLVELVIVIAIIAILAAVLIPTFSGVVQNANKSAALQTAKNAYTEYLAADENNIINAKTASVVIKSGDYYFLVAEGVMNTTANSAKNLTWNTESTSTAPAGDTGAIYAGTYNTCLVYAK